MDVVKQNFRKERIMNNNWINHPDMNSLDPLKLELIRTKEALYTNELVIKYKKLEKEIGKKYGVEDVNKIKPGVGETTRVLLRRLPDRVLIRNGADEKYLKHIKRLCEEKNVPIEYVDLKKYNVA